MADSNNSELIGFIGGRFEALNERFEAMNARLDGMVTREYLDVSITAVRGDIEQVQLRLDSMEHSVASRFELVEGQISRLRSAVYLLAKDDPDVLRLLGHQNS